MLRLRLPATGRLSGNAAPWQALQQSRCAQALRLAPPSQLPRGSASGMVFGDARWLGCAGVVPGCSADWRPCGSPGQVRPPFILAIGSDSLHGVGTSVLRAAGAAGTPVAPMNPELYIPGHAESERPVGCRRARGTRASVSACSAVTVAARLREPVLLTIRQRSVWSGWLRSSAQRFTCFECRLPGLA